MKLGSLRVARLKPIVVAATATAVVLRGAAMASPAMAAPVIATPAMAAALSALPDNSPNGASGNAQRRDPPGGLLPPAISRWRPFIVEAARRFDIPVDWIAAVMAAESAGQTMKGGRPIVSRAGAMGLMQIMPATWAMLRSRLGLGPDPHDPHDNIVAGTAYLRLMYDRFGYPGLFGAYNAGPARYAAFVERGKPLPGETRAYVGRLARRPATPIMPPAILSGTRLFFLMGQAPASSEGAAVPAPNASREAPPSEGLFVPRAPPTQGER